jgi:hypothetical protein
MVDTTESHFPSTNDHAPSLHEGGAPGTVDAHRFCLCAQEAHEIATAALKETSDHRANPRIDKRMLLTPRSGHPGPVETASHKPNDQRTMPARTGVRRRLAIGVRGADGLRLGTVHPHLRAGGLAAWALCSVWRV